jgi:hypothetical protein
MIGGGGNRGAGVMGSPVPPRPGAARRCERGRQQIRNPLPEVRIG